MNHFQAIRAAKKLLKRRHGVNVICVDTLRNEQPVLTSLHFRRVVNSLVIDTLYWEGML